MNNVSLLVNLMEKSVSALLPHPLKINMCVLNNCDKTIEIGSYYDNSQVTDLWNT